MNMNYFLNILIYNTKVLVNHKICNKNFEVLPHEFFRKEKGYKSCPFCYKTKNTTKEQFEYKLKQKFNNEYELVGNYVNFNEYTVLKHNICGNEFKVKPTLFMNRTRCPYCSHRSFSYTTDEVKKEIKNLTNDEYTMLGDYKKENIPFLIKHNKCGHEWLVKRRNFIYNNTRCPNCYNMSNRSKKEDLIKNILDNSKINYDYQYNIKECKSNSNRKLYFDFYLKDYNTIIEFDGEQHFFPRRDFLNKLNQQKENDQIKNNFIKDSSYNFIRIHYKVSDLEIKNILKELIENKYLSSTTIEKNKLLVLDDEYFYNEKDYYLNIDKNYFD